MSLGGELDGMRQRRTRTTARARMWFDVEEMDETQQALEVVTSGGPRLALEIVSRRNNRAGIFDWATGRPTPVDLVEG